MEHTTIDSSPNENLLNRTPESLLIINHESLDTAFTLHQVANRLKNNINNIKLWELKTNV